MSTCKESFGELVLRMIAEPRPAHPSHTGVCRQPSGDHLRVGPVALEPHTERFKSQDKQERIEGREGRPAVL